MFEGKHIHFSPVDNKPLCSYSSKLCRQRRLNGFAFCIRHILEDKSAPFKQCDFVTRNNFQKCLNAIPLKQERGYCHSHMQVAGIIPKTERKSKVSNGNVNLHNGSNGKSSNGPRKEDSLHSFRGGDSKLLTMTRGDQLGISNNPTATYQFSNKSKNNNNNNINNTNNFLSNGKSSSSLATSNISSISSSNNNINNSNNNNSVKPKFENSLEKNHKTANNISNNGTTQVNGVERAPQTLTTPILVKKELQLKQHPGKLQPQQQQQQQQQQQAGNETAGKKKLPSWGSSASSKVVLNGVTAAAAPAPVTTEKQQQLLNGSSSDPPPTDGTAIKPIYTLCVRDSWKHFNFHNNNAPTAPSSDPKASVKLARMKTIKVLEKLPLFMEVPVGSSPAVSNIKVEEGEEEEEKKKKNSGDRFVDKLPSSIDFVLFPPSLRKKKLGEINNSVLTTSVKLEDGVGSDLSSNNSFSKTLRLCNGDAMEKIFEREHIMEWETRKDYLSRVRSAFKRQYQTMKKVCKLSDKVERGDRAFRSALLSCAIKDSSLCAQIISSGVPKLEQISSLETNNNSASDGTTTTATTNNKPQFSNGLSKGSLDSFSQPSLNRNGVVSNNYLTSLEIKREAPPSSRGSHTKAYVVSERSGAGDEVQWQNQAPERKKLKGNKSGMKKNVSEKAVTPRPPRATPLKSKGNLTKLEDSEPNKRKPKKAAAAPSSLKKRKLPPLPNNLSSELQFDTKGQDDDDDDDDDEHSTSLKAALETAQNDLLRDSLNTHHHHHHHPHHHQHQHLLSVPSSVVDLQAVANLETVLHSVSSSDAATTPEGVMTDTSFDSPFNHSSSSHPDCEFSDDDLEKSFELQIDPEIAHQASRLLEDNGLTEDDFNELFPETRVGDHKLAGRADLGDLGIDFTSNFDASDIDYSLFANIFPNFRSSQHESIPVNQQF